MKYMLTDGTIQDDFADDATPVYEIPDVHMVRLEERFAELERRAKKLDCEPPTFEIIGSERKDLRNDEEIEEGILPYYEITHHVVVHGSAPKFAGWEFIGTIESETEAVTDYMIRMVPNVSIPPEYKKRDQVDPRHCSHCGHNRYRKVTYLVRKGEEVKQVGSSCIKDFLGHSSPHSIASYLQWLFECSSLEDFESYGGGGEYVFDTIDFLEMSRCVMRNDGWISRSKARQTDGQATADIAWRQLVPSNSVVIQKGQREWRAKVVDSDREFAEATLTHLQTLWQDTDDELNDYMFNLRAATEGDVVSWKTSGLVASALSVYARHIEREAEKKLNQASNHVGDIDEKLDVGPVNIFSIRWVESMYGSKALIKMRDDAGNLLVWWYSGQEEYKVGERYGCSGTVVKHGEYNGTKETTLKRCTMRHLDRVFVKFTKAQAKLLNGTLPEHNPSWRGHKKYDDEPNWIYDGDFVKLTDVAVARELIASIEEKGGRAAKGAIKKIHAAWAQSELEAL